LLPASRLSAFSLVSLYSTPATGASTDKHGSNRGVGTTTDAQLRSTSVLTTAASTSPLPSDPADAAVPPSQIADTDTAGTDTDTIVASSSGRSNNAGTRTGRTETPSPSSSPSSSSSSSPSAITTNNPLDGIAERVHEAVDLLLTSARHHDEWRASMATIGCGWRWIVLRSVCVSLCAYGISTTFELAPLLTRTRSSAHSIAESALALRRLVVRTGDSNATASKHATSASTSARRQDPKSPSSHNQKYKSMYDTVLVRLPSSSNLASASSSRSLPPAVMYPTLIEPLTESLRSAQHDLAPGDINTLEHRGTMLLLPV
jgi:hypothetical protein